MRNVMETIDAHAEYLENKTETLEAKTLVCRRACVCVDTQLRKS